MAENEKREEQVARDKFESLVRTFSDAVLVTVTDQGPHGRPMLVAGVDRDSTLWFITNSKSAKVNEISSDQRVLAVMKSGGKYLCVRGLAAIVDDREKAKELWAENHRIWFTGPEDETLILVRLDSEFAEYWDQSGKEGIKFAIEATKAYLKRQPLSDRNDVAQHAKVEL